jgi:DNA polymerase/3'-5' exonuclease PolX
MQGEQRTSMSIMQITQTIHIMPPLLAKRNKHVTQPTLPGMEPEVDALPKITNRQIAEVLSEIADMLATQNANPYRIQAYRNAARGVLDLQEQAADILARGGTLPVPGLGERLRTRISEFVKDGTMTINSGIYTPSLPNGVRVLMTLDHIGPYTAIRLYEELDIDSVEKLWRAANQQRIRALEGFGVRSEARLKAAAEHLLHTKNITPIPLHGAA